MFFSILNFAISNHKIAMQNNGMIRNLVSTLTIDVPDDQALKWMDKLTQKCFVLINLLLEFDMNLVVDKV